MLVNKIYYFNLISIILKIYKAVAIVF